MIIQSDDIRGDIKEKADICIIGSGSSGSVMAMEMAEAGFSVIVLEEGGHFSGAQLNQREAELLPKLYSQRYTKDLSIALSQARCLGGGTLINMADCVRTPDAVFEMWGKEFGIEDISPKTMFPYFEKAETILKAKKITEDEINPNNRILMTAARERELSGGTFINNREDCIYCGYCLLGCTYNRKQATTLNYIPMAMEAGAKFYVNARAERVLARGGMADRVTGVVLDRETRVEKAKIEVIAKVIILAANTINTPQLLLNSDIGNESGLVGKNLILQPHTMVLGLFSEELKSYQGIPQSYYVDEFEEVDEKRGISGFRLEGGFTLPGQVSTVIPGFGYEFKELMTKYNYMANMMVLVYDDPTGEVTLNRSGRPVINYDMTGDTKTRMVDAMKEAATLMFTGGAEKVIFTYEVPAVIDDPNDISIVDERGISPCSQTLMSFHMQGTCRMGPDPNTSVVDSYLESHDVKNLFIVDASVAPSTAGSHNMLPIMAMAHRTANYILINKGRYFG